MSVRFFWSLASCAESSWAFDITSLSHLLCDIAFNTILRGSDTPTPSSFALIICDCRAKASTVGMRIGVTK